MSENAWCGPLAGLRVLDFTRVLAGPAASLALADLGAEVIKIEPPGAGDDTRTFPPHREGESHYFIAINRGKKSIVIDLKTDAGRRLVEELVQKSDIIIENFRPGVMDKLGLSYAHLSAINPGLIYCSISGYGMTGPLKDRPSFDIISQALSGVLSVNGESGRSPVKLGLPMGDLVGGITGPIAILGALHERHATGKGRHIDISLLDGLIGQLGYIAQLAFFNGDDPLPQGNQHPNLVPYGSFPARDGEIMIACLTNAFWARICRALELEEFIEDERFGSTEARKRNRAAVNQLISQKTQTQDLSELADRLTEFEVPNAPVLSVSQALAQPQVQAREMVVEVEHATLGTIPIVNRPYRFVGENPPPPSAPPVLNEHCREILGEILGYDDDAIKELKNKGVIGG